MSKKHNAYDSGYKKLFSNHEFLRQLLTGFVNEDWIHEIEYSTIERLDKSFVSDEFVERESDIIYKVKFKGRDVYIFILLEFQSSVDRFMSLRMLRYITELYQDLLKNNRFKKLPSVFPLMLYNGEKRWTAHEEFNNLIESSIPDRYIPHFRYYKIAENEFSKEFLKKMKNSVSALFYTENCSGEELQKEIDTVVELLKTEKPEEITLFINWFKYMFEDKQELVEEIKELSEVKSMLRTSIKKYGKKLVQEGFQEGKLEGKLETAANLIKEKMSLKKISEITGLPEKEIKKMKDK
jgi:predicted transposase/invertase (TIGR01784 family)